MSDKRFAAPLLALLLACALLLQPLGLTVSHAEEAPDVYSFEGEAAGNVFEGNAGATDCGVCSGGKKVGGLYQGSSVTFQNVAVEEAGIYKLTVDYISGDPRGFTVSVNGGERTSFNPPATANWDTLGSYAFEVELNAGANAIKFDDDAGYAPDIDRIRLQLQPDGGGGPGSGEDAPIGTLVQKKSFGQVKIAEYTSGVVIAAPSYAITYNTATGASSYAWDGVTVTKGVYAAAETDRLLLSGDYDDHSFAMSGVEKISDGHGKGVKVTVTSKKAGLPDMRQTFRVYESQRYFLTGLEIAGDGGLSSDYMAPIRMDRKGGVDLGAYADNRVLVVPFDNDMWSRYQARTINTRLNIDNFVSSEVTAVYDNDSRKGLVIGSVEHDAWKTGIRWSGSNDRLDKLEAFGGFTSASSTHDTQPHGALTGKTIKSPDMFVGYFADYRDGMETFGKANAAVAPPLEFGERVPEGVPVGWNSWGAYDSRLSYDKVIEVSNFFKNNLQHQSFTNNGDIYINLDSYWDNLTEQQLKDAVKTIHANGQRAGIYYSPFVYWGSDLNQPVEGTNGAYTYGDIVLRDADGEVLPKMDGAYAVDPTHPGTKQRMDYYFGKFLDLGFEYVKIDFLSHGSLEGVHYDPAVKTGIQAYNEGMAYMNRVLDGKMFISASIAPLFPSQYAHSRRISCDVDGSLPRTEYQLNNLTYGWWQDGTIYRYTDPDYMTLKKGGSLEGARSRVNAAAISGTVFLNSDDVSDPEAQELMKQLLTNETVNKLAVKGKAFRPVEGNTGTAAADAFVLNDKGKLYLAVFNYTEAESSKTIDLARAGLSGSKSYRVTDLWTGKTAQASGELSVDLAPAQSRLFEIKPGK